MAVVKIVTEPNNVLHKKCDEINVFDKETEKLAQNLLDTVRDASEPIGAGLAAPQIGVTKRMCVVRKFADVESNEDTIKTDDYVLVNPAVKRQSKEKELDWEGCLSLPDLYAQVERSIKITVEAYDQFGNKISINASGFFARVIQHEIDHLDGILITDKNVGSVLSEKQFETLLKEYRKL